MYESKDHYPVQLKGIRHVGKKEIPILVEAITSSGAIIRYALESEPCNKFAPLIITNEAGIKVNAEKYTVFWPEGWLSP